MSSHDRETVLNQILSTVRNLDHDLTLALSDLDHCARHIGTPARPAILVASQAMQDARPGLPGAQAYDAPSVSGSTTTGSQPERMAMQDDPTQADRDLLDRLLTDLWTDVRGAILEPDKVCNRVTRNALSLRRLVDTWTPHAASARDLREVTTANVKATECQLTREALKLWAPVHRTSDLWGLLPDPAPVSRWVWRFAKDHQRLPTPMEWQHQRSKDDDLRAQAMATVK